MEKTKINRPIKQRGFTLIELMITLTIAVILISTTAPSLMSSYQNNKMVSLHNDLLSDLALARSTAVTRGNSATLCASNTSGSQCVNNSTNWSHGWLVFNDIDNDGVVDITETVLTAKGKPNQIDVITSADRISFGSDGTALGFSGEFAFCDSRGESAKRGLIVSNSGRSRVAEATDIAVTCP